METNSQNVEQAVAVLAQGGVIVYPTDTVYGLGADATFPDAVMKVRMIKQRAEDTPILAMVRDVAMLEEYAELTPLAQRLAEVFLPGPLALILTPRDQRLQAIAGRDGGVGFRIPKHPTCEHLTRVFEKPITSTSFNKTGEPQPRTIQLMLAQIGEAQKNNIDMVLDEGELPESTPSTVVDARGEYPILLREGAIYEEQLRDFF